MLLEQKLKLAGVGALATIAGGVFLLGTWKAIEGSALYMTAAEGRTETEGLMYAAMIAGTALLASNASVFLPGWKRLGFGALAIVLAGVTIYTTHAGKMHDLHNQIDTSRDTDRALITNSISEYSNNIRLLSESLAKMPSVTAGNTALIDVPNCTKGKNDYQSCLANRKTALAVRARQDKAALDRMKQTNTAQQSMIDALERAKADLAGEKGNLAVFDAETNRLKAQKQHDSLLTNAISAVMPEIASLLGSFFLSFFLNTMYMIFREKHSVQLAVQFGTVGGTTRYSDVYHQESGATHAEIEQWSALPEMTPVQQTTLTPLAAEQELVAALHAKTAPLSIRPAQKAFPSVARRRFSEIFSEQFNANVLNRRIDAKGGISYEYPDEGEKGGTTYQTATAQARQQPSEPRGIYLAINNGAAA